MRESNYEIMKRSMAAKFLEYDQEAMIRKFHLRSTEETLFLRFFDEELAVNRQTGEVRNAAGEAGHNETMTVYDVLCSSKSDCHIAGTFVNMRSLSAIQRGSSMQEGDGIIDLHGKAFDHKKEALAAACERLGGTPEGKGDVSYRIPLFPFLPVLFQFWESDEDFPPTVQFFVDANMLDFMHYETVWMAFSYLMERLQAEIG